jgi:hypothetical protein
MFTSLDKFRYFDSTMWVQDSGQVFFLVVTSPAVRSKHTSDLSKNTDGMNRVNIRNDIAVRLLVLEQKSAEIGLTALHHLFYGGDDSWIANDDSLIKTGKERTSCNGKSKDLGAACRTDCLAIAQGVGVGWGGEGGGSELSLLCTTVSPLEEEDSGGDWAEEPSSSGVSIPQVTLVSITNDSQDYLTVSFHQIITM